MSVSAQCSCGAAPAPPTRPRWSLPTLRPDRTMGTVCPHLPGQGPSERGAGQQTPQKHQGDMRSERRARPHYPQPHSGNGGT